MLYVCPLKALLNNLLPRLEQLRRLARPTGRALARRRGDRRPAAVLWRAARHPAHHTRIAGVDAGQRQRRPRQFFAGLRAVVVDEVHAFAGDDRGWHLLAVLERLTRLAGRPLQRVGLSATVGNPNRTAGLAAGIRPRAAGRPQVVAPTLARGARRPGRRPATWNWTTSARSPTPPPSSPRCTPGEKRLVFCESRQTVEELGQLLRARGVTTFLSHASLSADERRRAEQAFAEARDCVIVSTSTLELGIDVGDLDRVIQIDAPPTVASFLQRTRPHRPAAGSHPQLPVPRHRRDRHCSRPPACCCCGAAAGSNRSSPRPSRGTSSPSRSSRCACRSTGSATSSGRQWWNGLDAVRRAAPR